jgi:hypothetical protein
MEYGGRRQLPGSTLVVNLTVMGFGVRQPAERLARQVAPWALGGRVLKISSDVPMLLSRAQTSSGSIPLLINMTLLVSTITLSSRDSCRVC